MAVYPDSVSTFSRKILVLEHHLPLYQHPLIVYLDMTGFVLEVEPRVHR